MYELNFVWRHSALIIPSLTARRQSVAATIQQIPDYVVKAVTWARYRVDVWGERSGYRSVWSL